MLSRAMGLITIMCLNFAGGGAVSHSLIGECSLSSALKLIPGQQDPKYHSLPYPWCSIRFCLSQESLSEEAECP